MKGGKSENPGRAPTKNKYLVEASNVSLPNTFENWKAIDGRRKRKRQRRRSGPAAADISYILLDMEELLSMCALLVFVVS